MSTQAEAVRETHAAADVPPHYQLLQMITGYWMTQSIYVAAKLGIADLVADGPRQVDDLARACGAQADLLNRVLRALSSVGIFTAHGKDSYGLTPLANLLRSDLPNTMRPQAIMHGEEQYRAWSHVLQNVKTGEIAFEKEYDKTYFGYLAEHPEADRVFNEAQAGYTKEVAGAVVDAYDFTPFATVVDVGAGYGPMLLKLLGRYPHLRGILFDQPHVADAALARIQAAGLTGRCLAEGGDFFAAVPPGGDAYILSLLLHDWDEERSIAILKNIRRAIAPNGRLLVVELVLPEGQTPFFGKWLDLHMAVLLGARERTANEFRDLFAASGFKLQRIIPTSTGMSIVEAVPV